LNSIFFLIPLGLCLLVVAVAAFVWAVRNGQFDDLETPAARILFDDERPRETAEQAPPRPD
jgi:cbb3-type cytochrome oxidase maturation protein